MKAVAQRHERIVVDTSVVCRIVKSLESKTQNNRQTILKWRQFRTAETPASGVINGLLYVSKASWDVIQVQSTLRL
jgi:hypothetical protein